MLSKPDVTFHEITHYISHQVFQLILAKQI